MVFIERLNLEDLDKLKLTIKRTLISNIGIQLM